MNISNIHSFHVQFYLLDFFHIALSFLVFHFFLLAHFSCYIFPYFTLSCYSPPCCTHFKFQSFQVALFSCYIFQRHRDIKFRLAYLKPSKNIARNISSVWTKSQWYLGTVRLRNTRNVWKLSIYGVLSGSYFLAVSRISPYSVRMRENTNQKKLHIWTLFSQWHGKLISVSPWEELSLPLQVKHFCCQFSCRFYIYDQSFENYEFASI